jgi:hypothetical protein
VRDPSRSANDADTWADYEEARVEAAHLCDPMDIDTRADLEALAASA